MVHKKSEYELQFHKLSNDIRAQIWKDNFMFRETHKRMNLSDHYWRYQLIDDTCECEEGSKRDSVIRSSKDLLVPNEVDKPLILFQDKAVQTMPCQNTNKSLNFEERNVNGNIDSKNNPPTKELEVTTEPSDSKQIDPLRSCTTQINGSTAKQQKGVLKEERYNLNESFQNLAGDKASLTSTGAHQKLYFPSHLNPSPTRNALKSYHNESRISPIFAAYGWNDSDRDVGEQKTFNVRAPVNQVHHSALSASGKRLKELELHLAEQLKKKRQQKSELSVGPVNLSSIWMTEYQENFSRGHREPLSHKLYRRPIVWRYT